MQLHFQSVGDGSPVVILHGLFGSLDNWQSIAHRLSAAHRVVTVDLPNHGRSPHTEQMDYPSLARDLHEFAQAQHLAAGAVIGHSMGGKVAMQWALDFPDDLDRVVVVDLAPRAYAPRHLKIIEGLLALQPELWSTRHELETALAPFVRELAVRRFLLKGVEHHPSGGFRWRMGVREIARNYEALSRAVSGSRPFEKPALFVRGEKSDYLAESDMTLAKQLFPRASLVTIPGASHWVQADAPDAFCAVVSEFLAGNHV